MSSNVRPRESPADERAVVVVRMAVRAFGNGESAGAWLAQPNELLGGDPPLIVARLSVGGCAQVCRILDDLAAVEDRAPHSE